MLSLNIFLVLLVLVVAFFLFFKLLKGVIKALIAVLFLTLFVMTILGIIVYFDVAKIKNSFNHDQTVLLSHEGIIVAGFSYDNNEDTKVLQSSKLQLLTKEELSSINTDLSKNEYSSGDGLTLIADSSYFYDTSLDLTEGVTVTLTENVIDDVFTCTKMSSCINSIVDVAPALQKQIESSFENEQDLKNKLFFNLFAEKSKDTKGTFIISGIRDEKVLVYPQLTTIKLIQMMPEKLVNKILNKTIETTADNMESNITE